METTVAVETAAAVTEVEAMAVETVAVEMVEAMEAEMAVVVTEEETRVVVETVEVTEEKMVVEMAVAKLFHPRLLNQNPNHPLRFQPLSRHLLLRPNRSLNQSPNPNHSPSRNQSRSLNPNRRHRFPAEAGQTAPVVAAEAEGVEEAERSAASRVCR
ncbi:MAG: hypothetical protein Q8Q97_01265 [bacterium]|nr:hypothetical protein [bacterium]